MVCFSMPAFFVALSVITSLSLPIPHKTEKIVSRESQAGNGEAESQVDPHSAPAEVFARGVNKGEGGSTQNPARSRTGPGELPYHAIMHFKYNKDGQNFEDHYGQLQRPDGSPHMYTRRVTEDGKPVSTTFIQLAPNGSITRVARHYFYEGEPLTTIIDRGDGHTVNHTGQGFSLVYLNDHLNARRSRFAVMHNKKLVFHLTPVHRDDWSEKYTDITPGYEQNITSQEPSSRPPPIDPNPNDLSWIIEGKDLHGQIGPIPVHHLDAYELAQKHAARHDSQAH